MSLLPFLPRSLFWTFAAIGVAVVAAFLSSWSCDHQAEPWNTQIEEALGPATRPVSCDARLGEEECTIGLEEATLCRSDRASSPTGDCVFPCGRYSPSPCAAPFLFLTPFMPTFARLANGENVLFRLTPRPAAGIVVWVGYC